jgi:CD109 antigen
MAIIPKVLQSGTTSQLSVALMNGDSLAAGDIEVKLSKDGKTLASSKQYVLGKDVVDLKLPPLAAGDYEINVSGPGFNQKASVQVASSSLIFLETDKPIYKPGQTIHVSAFSLDGDLKPVSQKITFEAVDGKSIKIFKQELITDDYGMASVDLPLSMEPNLGTWKLNAAAADGSKTELDVTVDTYVLPKYEVNVTLPKDWFLASDRITGKVEGIYSFGKPVQGEVEIVASRYVGTWQEYARFTKDIDGSVEFELPPVGYVAGVPASGGLGNVNLEFTVREQSTGYEESATKLLTISSTPVTLQIIPDSVSFKPGLPLNVLILSQDPGGLPVPSSVSADVTYLDNAYKQVGSDTKKIDTGASGMGMITLVPPSGAVALTINTSAGSAYSTKNLLAAYSPSSSFIHVAQVGGATLAVGATAKFHISATKQAPNFYYEVVARDRVVFSDYSTSPDISLKVTPAMSPSAKLLVYQVLPNSEVAADFVPFDVTAEYPQTVSADFSKTEAKPGDSVDLNIKTENQSHVIVTAVDKSVFILAENRLNLTQVFAELEKLYMDPQAELHEVTLYPSILTTGASDVFKDAGVIALSNNTIPAGKQYDSPNFGGFFPPMIGDAKGGNVAVAGATVVPAPTIVVTQQPAVTVNAANLADVQRIRQYFPETWISQTVVTDSNGKATLKLTVPDSITTWMLRAVAISKDKGLGVAETSLKAFQPFFLKLDLTYSAIRGEEFPVKVAVYNYLDESQDVVVTLDKAGWFDVVGATEQTVRIAAGEVGSAVFTIRSKGLGFNDLKVSARSTQAADAVIQSVLVQPEGVPREFVDNLVLSEGESKTLDTTIPSGAVADSGKVYLTLTGSYLTQTLQGLEGLIQMPYGCGEQNMLNFAPDVFITKYLTTSGQVKPDIMAKAELLMVTGYQRELTYRRTDGSFSAFGMQDSSGSLWLTAFVLKSFSQAQGLIYIDSSVLDAAKNWIIQQQKADGSFEAVGFVHHQELLGGLSGKDALTAYVAVALMEAGDTTASAKAVLYLETRLGGMTDAYTLALTSYAFEMAGSPKRDDADKALMALAQEDENGLHWGNTLVTPPVSTTSGKMAPIMIQQPNRSAVIETTAYAMLALIRRGDNLNAGRAGTWLISQRNAYGGFGSTQDTVVGLQALSSYATGLRADVDLTVSVKGPGVDKQVRITSANFDVLQIVELPANQVVTVTAKGKGEVMAQVVRRYNVPAPDEADPVIKIGVKYDATDVAVNDLVNVLVDLIFNPPAQVESGMLVVDISVPTGFAADTASIDALMKSQPLIKRYDIAGRKVIFYIDNLKAGAKLSFSFKVLAQYPVKAKGAPSQAYSYYQPEFKGESLGQDMTIK